MNEYNTMNEYNIIESTAAGSIAEEIGLETGDRLIKINGREINDILEYKYLEAASVLELEILTKSGETANVTVEKDEYEDLGISFKYPLMSKPKSCKNKCIFCFIDQLPQGMRETLYFKDDDSRLSFLQGNYVTLTNLSDEEIRRIGEMRISPVNVSVHTTNPALRIKMMNNKSAGNVLEIMKKWQKCKIVMNCQIVLCKNVNDGAELDRTLSDLAEMYPSVSSVSVVPCGLSDHRENLYHIDPFLKQDANAVIAQIERHQNRMLQKFGTRFVYPADEFFLTAEKEIPPYEYYEDFPQIENGVGLLSSMEDEFTSALETLKPQDFPKNKRTLSIATGAAAFEFIKKLAAMLENKSQNLNINVYKIENRVFGSKITVAGLLCGCDIVEQLCGKPLGEQLLISSSMLRSGEDVLLDDMRVGDIAQKLGVTVTPTQCDGESFINAVLGR